MDLFNLITPIKDNSTYEYFAKNKKLNAIDKQWHRITIVVKDGIQTNYMDGIKIN